jgi:hypothetical protein
MPSLLGSFQSCGDGNHSTSITCSGTSCAAIQKIPGLTCTNGTSGSMTCSNGNECASASNLTSSFAIQGPQHHSDTQYHHQRSEFHYSRLWSKLHKRHRVSTQRGIFIPQARPQTYDADGLSFVFCSSICSHQHICRASSDAKPVRVYPGPTPGSNV